MSPIASRTCTKAASILTEHRGSFSNQAIRSSRISCSADPTVGAIDLDPAYLAKPITRSTVFGQNESARTRFGIQSRDIRFHRMRGLGWLSREVRPSRRGG